jgi:hypothetical protein
MLSEPLLVVARLALVFDGPGISYAVGGSLASSLYGTPRATQDVDLVAELDLGNVDAFAKLLAGEFCVDANMFRDAVQRRASFNVVHLATMFKAAVFIPSGDAWSREELARARIEEFDTPGGRVPIRFASAEDTLLHKLVWFKLGNEVSDRQWGDIAAVLKVQGDSLDRGYLERWAGPLSVAELLERAWREHDEAKFGGDGADHGARG